MNIITKHKLLLFTLASVMLAGMWVYRLGSNDVKAVTDFAASYKRFDTSITDLSTDAQTANPDDRLIANEAERKADEALADLNTRATVKISSLTKNDGAMMNVARELSELSTRELEALKAYRRAVKDKNADSARTTFTSSADFRNRRKSAFVRWSDLVPE
jgi:hypothetical protein